MDPASENTALLIFLFLSLATVATYAWVSWRIAKIGGKVPAEKFGSPDMILGGLLIAYCILDIVVGFRMPTRQIHDSDLVDTVMLELAVVGGICSFLYFRGINLRTQFGLRAMRLDKVAGLAFVLLLAFYPMMIFSGLLTEKMLGPEAKMQELVKSFMEANQNHNYKTLIYTFITGVIFAPVMEEILFRGYIYVTLKRYLGITAGVVLNSILFAGIHVNAASLPSLFLLAICLTLAYEFSGSILVNIGMHSLLNFCALTLSFYNSASSPQ